MQMNLLEKYFHENDIIFKIFLSNSTAQFAYYVAMWLKVDEE